MFFYWPVLGVCEICILLAFHRSNVVEGKESIVKVFAYVLLFVVSVGCLYGAGKLIGNGARTYLIDMADAIAARIRTSALQGSYSPEPVGPPFSVRVTSLVTNEAAAIWARDNNALHSNYICRVPMLAEVYLTNNRSTSTAVTSLGVEAVDVKGDWRRLGVIETFAVSPVYKGTDFHKMQEIYPMDGKYFDQQIVGKNIGPGETVNGWLFLEQDLSQDIRWPLRFSLRDIHGEDYETGPVDVNGYGLLEGGFVAGQVEDLSDLKREKCPVWNWQ